MRATRRIDELRQAQKATVGLARGGGEKGVGRRGKNAGSGPTRITLAEVGINKHLANEARKLGALSEPAFDTAVQAAQNAVRRVVRDAARTGTKAERRAERKQALAGKILALPDKH